MGSGIRKKPPLKIGSAGMCCFLILGWCGPAAPGQSPAERKVRIEFSQADVIEVAEFFSALFEVNMVVDPECGTGRVTAYTPDEIEASQAWEVFLAILGSLKCEAVVHDGSAVLVRPGGKD